MKSAPPGIKNDAAQVHALEARVLVRQEIVVERAERGAWTMLHAVEKSIDHFLGEISAARKACDHGRALCLRKLIKTPSRNVHPSSGLHQRDLTVHVLGNAGRRVERYSGPHLGHVRLVDMMAAQKISRGVGAVDFET